MKRPAVVMLSLALLLIAGCASMEMQDRMKGNDRENVFAFGYIDIDMQLSSLGSVSLMQVLPKTPDGKVNEENCWTQDGAFFNGNLLPGTYALYRFSMGKSQANFGSHAFLFKMDKPGIYFLGSYKVKRSADIFSSSIGLEKQVKPTESEVLGKFIIPSAAGTKWELPLKNRLKELKGIK